ncbi:MAG TPA: SDR family oxidoreductase [Solirubrobacteraceae bacterium]|jgi:NADP-dependent 3-hydroxy acid dehydrogenase YdfG
MAKQPRILAGETVAITGAARGIGRATAEALLRQGMKVAIGDVDLETARQTAAELGASTIALPLDVTDRASFTAFLDAAEQQLGPLDVLINNAGIMQVGRFIDEDDLTARRMIDINLHGVILGMKLALARMIPRDRGHIVNISSQAGKFGTPGGATYSATKHAVVGMTEAVRGELRLMGAHIDLSYVMPFVVNTELGVGLGEARGMSNLEPTDVADAIVEALRMGIVDVWVPKSAKRTNMLTAVLPRSASEGIARALKADRVLAGADLNTRRAYELRASRSEPGLEPATPTPQIASSPGAAPSEAQADGEAVHATGDGEGLGATGDGDGEVVRATGE